MINKIPKNNKMLWIDDDLHHEIKLCATECRVTMKSFVKSLLENYNESKKRN